MKKRPDPDIVEQIVTVLGPLRRFPTSAHASVERALELLRDGVEPEETFRKNEGTAWRWECRHWHFRDGPDAASIRKAARNLRKALKTFSGERLIMLGADRTMPLHEFRCALDWLGWCTDDPPPKFRSPKYLAALLAYGLVNQHSQKPPSGASGGQVREIGTLLYQAISGEDADLKRQTDAVFRELRCPEKSLAKVFAVSIRFS